MDALPVAEKSGRSFASRNPGRMHACGHDGHMAMALGLAREVAANPAALNESLLIVFQPAEETTGGALDVVRSGIFNELNVRGIFGFHLWPDLEKGAIASRKGTLLAASNEVDVHIHGLGAHIARFREGHDAMQAAVDAVRATYDYLAQCGATEPCILRFGRMEAGTVRNQVASEAVVQGSLRTLSITMRDHIMGELPDVLQSAAAAHDCTAEVSFSEGYPPVVNDDDLFDYAAATLPELKSEPDALLIAEDFAWYQQSLPGLFMLLGTGTGIPLHADTFDFDEAILARGVDTYLRLLGLPV